MNEKEIAELRRRFRPEKSCISRIRGGCINEKKELVSEFDQPLGMLPEQEAEELLALLKKTLSGKRGRTLTDIEFSTQQVLDSDEHRLLMTLRDTALGDEEAVHKLYAKIAENVFFDGSYMILLAADRYGHGNKTEKAMTLSDALVIGLAQMIAVVPGLSRSGTTISAGMLRGFDRTFAVKFSFFLSIPAVLGANLLSLVKAISAGINWAEVPMYLCGVAAALVSGYLAIFALNRIAQRGKFGGFCYYCWGAGLLTLILSLIS